MKCPRMDHYGFAVGSLDELRGIQERAEAFRKSDDRMELIDLHMDDQGMVKIHSVYVRYLLPMTIEFQYWEFPEPAAGALEPCPPVRCGYGRSHRSSRPSRAVPRPARPGHAAPHAQRLGHRVRGLVRRAGVRGDRHHERRVRRHPWPARRRHDQGRGPDPRRRAGRRRRHPGLGRPRELLRRRPRGRGRHHHRRGGGSGWPAVRWRTSPATGTPPFTSWPMRQSGCAPPPRPPTPGPRISC